MPGDFSTPLEMTGRFIVPPLAGERWYVVPKGETAQAVRRQKIEDRFEIVRDMQTFRPQTSEGPFGPAVGGLLNKA